MTSRSPRAESAMDYFQDIHLQGHSTPPRVGTACRPPRQAIAADRRASPHRDRRQA
ncbi:MAG: hypothetical protein R2710_05195 [Acidimicrobiales bacterium]